MPRTRRCMMDIARMVCFRGESSIDYVMSASRPRLCATITADSVAGLRAKAAWSDAEMIELRLDGAGRIDVAEALGTTETPVILTCRLRAEGGLFDGSEEERRRILGQAVRSRAAYVDLEWQSGMDDLVAVRRGRGIILSHHDFAGVPSDLASRVAAMASTSAEIVKIAVTISRLSECLILRDLARAYAGRGLIVIGMGEPGLVTRVCAARFGAPWAYAGGLAGPGQVSVERMRREFRFGSIGADTTLYGLFGQPVSHSLSPAMHNAALDELGFDAVYLPLPGVDADDCLRFAEGFSLAGASVTAPYKSALLARLAERDAEAERVKAVNTIRAVPGGWAGTSTDAAGFLAGLGPVVMKGKRVAILGAGGAARSASAALAAQGASVTMYGRELQRVRASASSVGARAALRPVPRGSWDLLVNATPVGTYPDVEASAFPEGTFDGELVYDLVYNPAKTALLREAEAHGCRAIGGLGMLVEQARLQVQWWHGRTPSAGRMRDAARWRLDAAS